MNWSRRNNAPRRRLFVVSLAVLAVVGVDVVTGGAARSLVQRGVSYAHAGLGHITSVVEGSGFFSSRSALARENADLRARLSALEEERALCVAQAPEREILEKLAHLAEQSVGISARVVSAPEASPYGTFHIDVGHARGIAKGDAVVSPEGFLIGEVLAVTEDRATVAEVFAPGAQVIVSVGGAHAEALGMGDGNARIDIARGVDVQEGDAVVASNYARTVALVGHVITDASSATIHVYARSPINLEALSYVYVITR